MQRQQGVLLPVCTYVCMCACVHVMYAAAAGCAPPPTPYARMHVCVCMCACMYLNSSYRLPPTSYFLHPAFHLLPILPPASIYRCAPLVGLILEARGALHARDMNKWSALFHVRSCFLPPASCFLPPASCFLPPASYCLTLSFTSRR